MSHTSTAASEWEWSNGWTPSVSGTVNNRRGCQTLFLLTLAIVGAVLYVYVSVLDASPPQPKLAQLISNMPRVPVAADQAAFRVLQEAIHDQDPEAIAGLLHGDKAFSVSNNRHVIVLAQDRSGVVVQVLDGAQTGKTGWVVAAMVRYESSATTIAP